MLVDAYEKANNGDYSMVYDLHQLFKNPYFDGDTLDMRRYFRRANNVDQCKPGTAYMTCSS